MRVAVVTGHTPGEWDRLAAITLPGLGAYCDRHGYDLVAMDLVERAAGRPASWGKVPALLEALETVDLAVWVDADVVVDPSAPAIHEEFLPRFNQPCRQAFAVHNTPEGRVPNLGVWMVTAWAEEILGQVWKDYLDHKWWEQAALLRLMGVDPDVLPIVVGVDHLTAVGARVLDTRWNAIQADWRPDAYFRHAAGVPMMNREIRLARWVGMVPA